jgi:hypothetical protein
MDVFYRQTRIGLELNSRLEIKLRTAVRLPQTDGGDLPGSPSF